jgi:hypothetical protein
VSSLQPDQLTAAQALRLAGVAARRHGIEHEVRPVRASANHVFRAGDVVVRVAPRSADVASQVALARWLIGEGFRVPAPLADAVAVEGAAVSLWEHVDADPVSPDRLRATRRDRRSASSNRAGSAGGRGGAAVLRRC